MDTWKKNTRNNLSYTFFTSTAPSTNCCDTRTTALDTHTGVSDHWSRYQSGRREMSEYSHTYTLLSADHNGHFHLLSQLMQQENTINSCCLQIATHDTCRGISDHLSRYIRARKTHINHIIPLHCGMWTIVAISVPFPNWVVTKQHRLNGCDV